MVRLRVDIPADEVMAVERVRDHLRTVLEERGTERLDLADGNAVEELLLPGTAARSARIHWPAVTVVLFAERPAPPGSRPKPRNGKPASAPS